MNETLTEITQEVSMTLEESEEEEDNGAAILVAQAVVLLIIVLTYFLSTRKWLQRLSVYAPASTFMIGLGVVVGFIINQMTAERDFFRFNPEFFFEYLLPPIILSAGYSVRKDHFFHNFGSILLFAFLGTALSAAFIGATIFAVGQWGLVQELDFVNSMVIGSLLSAVDPISIVVVLKSLGVDENLYVLIFGEAVLNDAVAIVINRVFVAIAKHNSTIGALPQAIGEIIYISVCSMLIGIVIGLIGALIHKKSRFHELPHLEIGMFLVLAYMPYAVAELAGLSGIMSILFAGIVADYYTSYSLSSAGETTVREVVELVGFVAESFVFVSLGMTVALFPTHDFQIGLIAFALLWCLIGRVISVFPLAALLNIKRKHKISLKYQVVMFLSGLRGPVAFALSMAVPFHRDVIVTTTLAIAVFTTVVFGGAAMPILTRLNLTENKSNFTVEKFVDATDLFPTKYTMDGTGEGGGGGEDAGGRDGNPSFSRPGLAPSTSTFGRQRMGEFSSHREKESAMAAGVRRLSKMVRPKANSLQADLNPEAINMDGGRRTSFDGDALAIEVAANGSINNSGATTPTNGHSQRYQRNESMDWHEPDYTESRHWFNVLHQKYLRKTFRARQHKIEHEHGRRRDTLLDNVAANHAETTELDAHMTSNPLAAAAAAVTAAQKKQQPAGGRSGGGSGSSDRSISSSVPEAAGSGLGLSKQISTDGSSSTERAPAPMTPTPEQRVKKSARKSAAGKTKKKKGSKKKSSSKKKSGGSKRSLANSRTKTGGGRKSAAVPSTSSPASASDETALAGRPPSKSEPHPVAVTTFRDDDEPPAGAITPPVLMGADGPL